MVRESETPAPLLNCARDVLGPHASLTAVFQPIFALDTAPPAAIACEALARGPAGTRYEMPAAMFEAARQAGVVEHLDKLCVQEALAAAGASRTGLPVFLNVHPVTLREDYSFPAFLVTATWKAGIDPELVTIEILEHARVESRESQQILAALAVLRGLGVHVAVDDVCGSEDARRAEVFAPDYLKLDTALLHDARHDLCARDTLRGIAARADAQGCRVIAEGVEDECDLAIVRGCGIRLAQGFHLGRPQPAGAFAASVAAPTT